MKNESESCLIQSKVEGLNSLVPRQGFSHDFTKLNPWSLITWPTHVPKGGHNSNQ